MEWISIKTQPESDLTCLVINSKVDMLPIKAYWDVESEEFFSLESDGCTPISVTHYMPIPKGPRI